MLLRILPCVLIVAALIGSGVNADEKLKVLIVDGQNNHTAWPKTTVMMKQYLEESGRFTVDVQRSKFTWKGGDLLKEFPLDDGKTYQDLPKPTPDPDFKPKFSSHGLQRHDHRDRNQVLQQQDRDNDFTRMAMMQNRGRQ